MTIDIGNDMLQQLISIIQYALIYIAKIVILIGLVLVSKQLVELITKGGRRDRFTTIVKGIVIISFSIGLYFILV
jgi:hypothetical protein